MKLEYLRLKKDEEGYFQEDSPGKYVPVEVLSEFDRHQDGRLYMSEDAVTSLVCDQHGGNAYYMDSNIAQILKVSL